MAEPSSSLRVALVVAILAGLVAAGLLSARFFIRARREVRVTVVNERADRIEAVDLGGASVASLAPGERSVVAFEPVADLAAKYADAKGEVHLNRQYGCFGECTYWPPCSRPIVRIGEDGTTFDNGPPPSRIVAGICR